MIILLLYLRAACLATVLGINPATQLNNLKHEREMEELAHTVLKLHGLNHKIAVVVDPEAAKSCAYATTLRGVQYIGVFLECTGPLRIGGDYNWNAVGIICHEVGHLAAGHTVIPGSSRTEETEADEFAGYAMARLGASLQEALTFGHSLSPFGGKHHPPRKVRLASVERGYNRAKAEPVRSLPQSPRGLPQPRGNWWEDLMKTPLPWVSANPRQAHQSRIVPTKLPQSRALRR